MLNPQTQQAGSNPQLQATDGTPLNPLAVNLAKAIRLQEGGGKVDYGAVGDSGTSTGAYQFHGNNFKAWAQQYGLNPSDFSPTNQDKVAYARINDLLKQGRAPSEIAAMWNGAKEVGGKMMPINPAYVEGVKKYYSQIVGSGTTQQPQSQATAFADSSQTQQAPTSSEAALTGIPVVDSIANFLFPIAGDIEQDVTGKSKKSGLQQAGDLGLSLLPFIPGLGEVGEGARAAEAGGGLITKLLGSKLAQGAAVGYGAGALGNLSAGQSLGQAISPNLGTLGGAATGGLANTLLPKIFGPFARNMTRGGAQAGLEDSMAQEAGRLKPTQKLMAEMPNGGRDAVATIARTPDAIPQVVDNHHFDTTAGQAIMGKRASSLSELRAAALGKMGVTFSLKDLGAAATQNAEKQFADAPDKLQQVEKIGATLTEYARNYGGDTVSPLAMEKIKEANPYGSPIARAARKALEDSTKASGAPDLQILNKEIQKHIHAQQILAKMQGQVVKGGRLGNMLKRGGFGLIGTIVGGALGGGWLGDIAGALSGDSLAKMMAAWQARTAFSSPVQEAILERLAIEDPAIVQQYIKYVGKAGAVIPQRAAPTTTGAGSSLRRLLLTSAARLPAMASSNPNSGTSTTSLSQP